jgi:hypothetical protein
VEDGLLGYDNIVIITSVLENGAVLFLQSGKRPY